MTAERRLTAQEAREILARPKQARSKYRAVGCYSQDGLWFGSKHERNRYEALRRELQAGDIESLVLQPRYDLHVDGTTVGFLKLDFRYVRVRPQALGVVVEDAKGMDLPLSRWKRKHFEAEYKIKVLIT